MLSYEVVTVGNLVVAEFGESKERRERFNTRTLEALIQKTPESSEEWAVYRRALADIKERQNTLWENTF